MLKPKLLTTLEHYTREQFFRDLASGTIVGVVALPLAIAFAIASGVSPEKGIITAIIAGFLMAALGGSRVQIGGPTGAFVVIVYGVVSQFGLNGLVVATMMAGVLLVIMGFARVGSAIKFIPYPVIVGFTSGIALIILSSQVKDLFGLQMGAVPAEFFAKWESYAGAAATFNPYALAIAAGSLLLLVAWGRFVKAIPGSLVVLVVSTAAVQLLGLPVETIGSRFGEISASLPAPAFEPVSLATMRQLVQPAITIALLAGIESLLSAVVADGMIGGKHRSNMELIAVGVANIASPLFGGIPATGAIARTATNIRNGGRTPVAGMVHALVLLVIMLFVGRWAALIPLASLAAILVMVSYHMSEWRSFRSLLRSPRSDVVVLLVTFGLTVVVDLTVAIEVGMLLAVFLFMRRMAMVTNVDVVTREFRDDGDTTDDPNAIEKRSVPKGVEVYEVNGPFFFGAAYKFEEAMQVIEKRPRVRILRMRNVPAVDSTGLQTLKKVSQDCSKHGIAFLISDIHAQPLFALEQSGLAETVGRDNIFGHIDDALNRAREIVGASKEVSPVPFVPTVARDGARRS